jgi:MoaA/NifB/PqqE/SkfB family radical SAM enzyme
MKIEKHEIIPGQSNLRDIAKESFNRVEYMLDHMQCNSAYTSLVEKKKIDNEKDKETILEDLKKRFREYRIGWNENPKLAYKKDSWGSFNPLCLDIETASICDLACPHCFREYILTPDKIMKFDFYKRIIDTAVELEVPSIKLNWRGEPLLNPQLEKFIKYAKDKGILEVSINTNATHLTKERSKTLIDSGLDLIIYSFDGGTKKTYEKLRPSRFEKNIFEKTYENIKNFHLIKKEKNKKFPVTKIQMVLIEDSSNEVEEFFKLFSNYVDDVSVSRYQERGGNMKHFNKKDLDKIDKYLKDNNLPKDTRYEIEANGNINVAIGRKPCEQLFQRLMITYDGRVAMCCLDWGAQHCLGYIDKSAFDIDKTINDLENKIKSNKKGFELLKDAKRPKKFREPKKKLSTLKAIWGGDELNRIRMIHKEKKLNTIAICKNCDFTDTHEWKKIN